MAIAKCHPLVTCSISFVLCFVRMLLCIVCYKMFKQILANTICLWRCNGAAAPEFSTEQIHESLTLKEGETVILELPYSASPAPRVTWDFNGRPLVSSRRVTVDVIRNMTSVCIGHVEMADAGTHTVTLENQFGKSTCSIRVKVFGEI